MLRVAVSHGLPGAELVDAADGMELRVTDEVISLAVRHRVQGLLVQCNRRAGGHRRWLAGRGRPRCSVVGVGRLRDFSGQRRRVTLGVLGSADVEARVLKGVALSELDYADPSQRVFADADLLIRRSDHGAALRALDAAGFRRVQPPVRGWWERRFGKAVELRAPERRRARPPPCDHRRLLRRSGRPRRTLGDRERTVRPRRRGGARARHRGAPAARLLPRRPRRRVRSANVARRRPARAGQRGRLAGRGRPSPA